MVGLPTSPEANEFEIEPRLTAASPPSVVNPLVPTAPVTSPVANAFVIAPLLEPTSPPPRLFDPTLTAPLAQVWPAAQGSTGTVVAPAMLAEATVTLPLAWELVMVPLTELEATSPPAMLASPACTLPRATEDTIVPELL